jgi:predicted nucleotide-binding protein (sugar kinase/HSP70/actin superfamily)
MSLHDSHIEKPFPVIFSKIDKKRRVLLIPNLSRSFTVVSAAVIKRAGYMCRSVPMADDTAKMLGKKFVHNDICYPAQINIGECLNYIVSNKPDPASIAIVIAKNCRDCRAGQYATLARKALDDAGYGNVPIVTTGKDTKGMHPGFKTGILFSLRMLKGLSLIDALEKMRLKIRPYESECGQTDKIFDDSINELVWAIEHKPHKCSRILKKAIESFNSIPVNMDVKRPKVFIIGEILMNYHETANNHIVRYLEKNGFEVLMPDMVSFFQREIIVGRAAISSGQTAFPLLQKIIVGVQEYFYNHVEQSTERAMRKFKYYMPKCSIEKLASHIDGMVDRTHTVGEGWLIPAEIIEYAEHGVRDFIIIQPFGCLPNQVTGKALIPTLKKKIGDVHIISLDYDADTSMANIENRLQMLIMAAKDRY